MAEFEALAQVLAFLSSAGVAVYMGAAGALSLQRRGDPARLVVFGAALLFALGFGRRLFFPDNQQAFIVVAMGVVVWAAFAAIAAYSYGRGPLR